MPKNKETLKTIAITVLVTAQLAFIAGIVYNQKQNDDTNTKINAAVTELKAELQTPEQKKQ